LTLREAVPGEDEYKRSREKKGPVLQSEGARLLKWQKFLKGRREER